MTKPTAATVMTNAGQSVPHDLFDALRSLFVPYQASLHVVHDEAGHFYANCRKPDDKGKPRFFGAVKASGRKHLLHFMPIYDSPELLNGISQALKKRMQGKSCFNFECVDLALIQELQRVVKRGVEHYAALGKL